MSDKLAKRVEGNRQIAEQNITAQLSEAERGKQRYRASMTLGAVAAFGHIARGLSAQTIRGLQKFRDEKLFEAFDFTRFDDFMDEFPDSPMTYRVFNDREKTLEKEGDDVFDVLNNLKLSHRQRKQLGAGRVQLDGETVIVITADADGEDVVDEIPLNDRARLLQTLSALADQNGAHSSKLATQKQKIERGEKEIESLQKKIDSGTGSGKMQLAHFEVNMRAMSQLTQYVEFVNKDLTLVEKERDGEVYLNSLWVVFNRLRDAYGRTDLDYSTAHVERKPLGEMEDNEISRHVAKKMKGFKAEPEDDEFAKITTDISDDELADLMED